MYHVHKCTNTYIDTRTLIHAIVHLDAFGVPEK